MGIKISDFCSKEGSNTVIYGCARCKTHLATSGMIASRRYQGRTGPAYLLNSITNVRISRKLRHEAMRSGDYLVRRIYCHQCNVNIGWKYVKSQEPSQLYKEGMYTMEMKRVCPAS